ncbi:MAG: hypothetical protein WCL18_05855 [bacterium]
MKKFIVVMFALVMFVANFATALTASDSTKTAKKVKGLSKTEYTIISDGDTSKVMPGDTSQNITFVPADSAKATGRTDTQMIGGKATKVKEVVANGQKGWVKADQDLTKPIEMWCDEDETGDPISGRYYGLIGCIVLAAGFGLWKFVFRG